MFMTEEAATVLGLGIVFYGITHYIASFLFSRAVDMAAYSRSDQLAFAEKICSSINGLVGGIAAIYYVFIRLDFEEDQLLTFHHDSIFAFGLAYQVYDIYIMSLQRTDTTAMWIHHGVVITGFTMLLFFRQAAFYPLSFFITELIVIPVNALWYIRSLGVPHESWTYKTAYTCRFLAYYVCRLWVAPWVFYRAITRGDYARYQEVHPLVTIFSNLNGALLTLLNLLWTVNVTSSYIKWFRSEPKIE